MSTINKHYVSDIDKALVEFDRQHPNSAAQQAEVDKYRQIYVLRDQPAAEHSAESSDDDLW